MPVIGIATTRTGTRPVGQGELEINVMDYGATGDGTTDDRAAVISAYTALTTAGGGILFFPAGTYLLSTGYQFTGSNTGFFGQGHATTIKFSTNAASPVLQFSSVNRVQFRDMTVDFGSQTAAISSIQVDGTSSDVTIRNIRFKNGKRPVLIAPGATDNVSVVRVQDCEFDSTTALSAVTGGYTGSGSTLTDVKVTNNHVKNVTGGAGNHAFAFYYASKIKVTQNTVDDTADSSCLLAAVTDGTVMGNSFAQQHVGIFVGNGSHEVRVIGNDVKSVLDQGISLYDAPSFGPSTELVVNGNTVHDCAAEGINVSDVNSTVVTGNVVARCGQNTAGSSTQRAGITVQLNTGGANRGCKDITVTGNTVIDDGATPKMQYGIIIQTPVNGLNVRANTVRGATTNQVVWVTSGGGITITAPYYVETDAGIYNSNPTTVTLATPTAVYGAGAGTSPPTMAIAGKDSGGIIFFGTGTTPTAGQPVLTVTFAKPYTTAPKVLGFGNNAASNGLGLYVDTGSVTTTGFNVYSANTIGASHAGNYEFGWIAIP